MRTTRPVAEDASSRLSAPDEGASAVEYSLLVVAIAAILVLVVFALGGYVKGAFSATCDKFDQAGVSAGSTATCSP